jgi:hypothetical protein
VPLSVMIKSAIGREPDCSSGAPLVTSGFLEMLRTAISDRRVPFLREETHFETRPARVVLRPT